VRRLLLTAVLLAAGTPGKRHALPNSRILIHQPMAGMEGSAEDIMIHAKEFSKIKERLNKILLKHTGHPLEKIEKDTDRDRFMSAEEAREYGLIDRVVEFLVQPTGQRSSFQQTLARLLDITRTWEFLLPSEEEKAPGGARPKQGWGRK
jgi:hypothetical protein